MLHMRVLHAPAGQNKCFACTRNGLRRVRGFQQSKPNIVSKFKLIYFVSVDTHPQHFSSGGSFGHVAERVQFTVSDSRHRRTPFDAKSRRIGVDSRHGKYISNKLKRLFGRFCFRTHKSGHISRLKHINVFKHELHIQQRILFSKLQNFNRVPISNRQHRSSHDQLEERRGRLPLLRLLSWQGSRTKHVYPSFRDHSSSGRARTARQSSRPCPMGRRGTLQNVHDFGCCPPWSCSHRIFS